MYISQMIKLMRTNVIYQNLLTIGNFEADSNSDGLADGWTQVSGVTASMSVDARFGSKAQLLSSPTGTYRSIFPTTAISATAGHVYYAFAYFKSVNAGTTDPRRIMMCNTGASSIYADLQFTISSIDGYVRKSVRGAVASGQSTLKLYLYNNVWNNYANSTQFDGAFLINLTQIFGAGNEPDQAWCDANIAPNVVF